MSPGCETGGKVSQEERPAGAEQASGEVEAVRARETWGSHVHASAACDQGLPTLDPEITTSCFLCKAGPTQNIIK